MHHTTHHAHGGEHGHPHIRKVLQKPILVTGATGFIAAHIVQQLLAAGYRVRGTVRSLANEQKLAPLQEIAAANKTGHFELAEADLMNADCWDDIVSGCEYVMHVASPAPAKEPKNEQDLIGPAVEGTLNVLRACKKAGTVKRVILTSSVAAVASGWEKIGRPLTPEDWSNLDNLTINAAYSKSKTLAERAAWDFVKANPEIELVVINPAMVIGPILTDVVSSSPLLIKRLLDGSISAIPDMNWDLVDVRDVASAHVQAMLRKPAAGHRYLLVNQSLHYRDIANVLRPVYGPKGFAIPSREAPYWLIWVLGRFDPTIRLIIPRWGMKRQFDNTTTVKDLGIRFRLAQDSILACADSLVTREFVVPQPRTSNRKRLMAIISASAVIVLAAVVYVR